MKSEKFVSLIVVVLTGLFFAILGDATRERCEAESSLYLGEAKKTLAEDLGTEPGNLTVYWSGEYRGNDRYRYEYRSGESGESYVDYVNPQSEDHVIDNDEARRLLVETVDKIRAGERWAVVGFFGLLLSLVAVGHAMLDMSRTA